MREVATALFAAWVEGRVSADATTDPAAAAGPNAADPRQQWLARWRELAASVTAATDGTAGLVDQLHDDRR